MRQPTLANRKRPVFVRCPVCGTEFWSGSNQRWCSRDCLHAAKRRTERIAALTPEAIRHQVDAAAGTMWRELVRRPTRKDGP